MAGIPNSTRDGATSAGAIIMDAILCAYAIFGACIALSGYWQRSVPMAIRLAICAVCAVMLWPTTLHQGIGRHRGHAHAQDQGGHRRADQQEQHVIGPQPGQGKAEVKGPASFPSLSRPCATAGSLSRPSWFCWCACSTFIIGMVTLPVSRTLDMGAPVMVPTRLEATTAVAVNMGVATIGRTICGIIAILLILEALRRSMGVSLVIVCGVFLLYTKFGEFLPGMLNCRPFSVSKLVSYIYVDPQ